jgi:uncharacterized protein (TIGR02147 family)
MLMNQTDYRNFLKGVLVERSAKNSAYSLRALARDLQVAPSSLSEVLKGSKHFSANMALQVAQRLGLTEDEQEYFLLLVQMATAKSPAMKDALQRRLKIVNPKAEVRDLSLELFKVVAEWYHFPILEMSQLTKFDFTPKSIAKKLGISAVEAELAIQRLVELELLEKDRHGIYQKTDGHVLAESGVPNSALRSFHKQMLAKASESVETQTPKEKVVGSETFAIDPALLDEAKQITDEYFMRMVRLARKSKKKTEIYHLGVQFFKITKGDRQ